MNTFLPNEMTVGGRTYELLSFHRDEKYHVKGQVMVTRAKEMNAHQGKEERDHLLKYQAEIPVEFRRKVEFVFTDDQYSDYDGTVTLLEWNGASWHACWRRLYHDDWHRDYRVLRRK